MYVHVCVCACKCEFKFVHNHVNICIIGLIISLPAYLHANTCVHNIGTCVMTVCLQMMPNWKPEERSMGIQALAGLLWSKQYYLYDVKNWLEGQTYTAAATADYHDAGDAQMKMML